MTRYFCRCFDHYALLVFDYRWVNSPNRMGQLVQMGWVNLSELGGSVQGESASGLQNAAISSASGATLRTNHLTGLTTDLGLGLIRAEVHHLSESQKKAERRANTLRF